MATRVGITSSFVLYDHPAYSRIRVFDLDSGVFDAYMASMESIDVEALQFVPFLRFIAAKRLASAFGTELVTSILDGLRDRPTGAVLVRRNGTVPLEFQESVKLATGVAFWLGEPARDDVTGGTYYARFTVSAKDDSDTYLRKAYRDLSMHSDGTYLQDPIDWVLMSKTAEENANGGRTKLLHVDDWSEQSRFYGDPLATRPLIYEAPASRPSGGKPVCRPTFHDHAGGVGLNFLDQFVHPRSFDEADYLFALSRSVEECGATRRIALDVGSCLLLNNHVWLHGRERFVEHPNLRREMIRVRGRFTRSSGEPAFAPTEKRHEV